MKRVLAINSSRRKRNTYNILTELKTGMKNKGIEVDIINLFDYKIDECTGCEKCLREGLCSIDDDVEQLMKKMQVYEGIILSTPIYMNNISGKLKVFLDRTCRWLHRPELVSKPIMFVATTSASGIKLTFEYLNNLAIQWGTFPTVNISRKVSTLKLPIREEEYDNFVNHIFMNKKQYKPSVKQLIQFQVQKVLAQKILPKDKEFWEAKHWLNKIYFYDAKISFSKRILVRWFYKFLYSKVKKVGT